ncbi:hypothetical protein QAD02_005826 [Eretmocerus hayati]|uniref:Uncharacterized protein n=1 Tax=Eretmocerus hayati TaxID=131215 RepID=A0ACC2NTY9_9HYME|nr:hypothetical protein QAD02_005826 [Eretmocerus hayati]
MLIPELIFSKKLGRDNRNSGKKSFNPRRFLVDHSKTLLNNVPNIRIQGPSVRTIPASSERVLELDVSPSRRDLDTRGIYRELSDADIGDAQAREMLGKTPTTAHIISLWKRSLDK